MTEESMEHENFEALLRRVRACQVCQEHLPYGPRPVIQAHPHAKILIIGQAPGRKVHETGIPWNDASGERLRQWMEVPAATFYDATQIAILPAGFCYPGTGASGDLPPRKECFGLWHRQLTDGMPHIRLHILLGSYAQKLYLGRSRCPTLTDTVRCWRQYLPNFFPLPHPSPLNNLWLEKNTWFEKEVLPQFKQIVQATLKG